MNVTLNSHLPPLTTKKGCVRGFPEALPNLTFYDFIMWQNYQNHVQNNAQRPVTEHKRCLKTSFSRDTFSL